MDKFVFLSWFKLYCFQNKCAINEVVCSCRNHPNILKLDLLHSHKYANMSALQLTRKVMLKKKEDVDIQENML